MARRPGTRRRADDDPEDKRGDDDAEDKAPGGATCGRKAADECGLKDSTECAIHGKGTKADDDDDKPDDSEKRLRRLERNVECLLQLATITGVTLREVGDQPDDDLPTEHHDAVRMAHKHIKSAHAFGKAEQESTRKAIGLLSDVCDAIDENGDDDGDPDDPDDKPDPEERARQLKRAEALRTRLRPV